MVPVGVSSKHMENEWNLQLLEVGRQAELELQQMGAGSGGAAGRRACLYEPLPRPAAQR